MGPAVHAPNSLLPRGMTRKPQNGYSFAGCVAPLHAPSHAEPRRPMGRLAVIWYTYLTPESCWPLLSPLCNTSDCYGALKEALMRQASPSLHTLRRQNGRPASHRSMLSAGMLTATGSLTDGASRRLCPPSCLTAPRLAQTVRAVQN